MKEIGQVMDEIVSSLCMTASRGGGTHAAVAQERRAHAKGIPTGGRHSRRPWYLLKPDICP